MKTSNFIHSAVLCILLLFLPGLSRSCPIDSDTTIEKSFSVFPATHPIIKRTGFVIKPTGDFDQRFVYIGTNPISIWGYRLGVLVNDQYKLGIGGYFYNQIEEAGKIDKNGVAEIGIKKHASFGTLYFEPYLLRKKRWELSAVLEGGYGKLYTDSIFVQREPSNATKTTRSIFPVGAGISANLILPDIRGFHFLTYLGLNGMVGIRKTPGEGAGGLYWSISSAIFIDRIFTDIKFGVRKK